MVYSHFVSLGFRLVTDSFSIDNNRYSKKSGATELYLQNTGRVHLGEAAELHIRTREIRGVSIAQQ